MQINDYVLQLVRLQDYAKTSQLIFTEVVGGVQNGPRKNSLHFVADQFNISKTVFFLYWIWQRFLLSKRISGKTREACLKRKNLKWR